MHEKWNEGSVSHNAEVHIAVLERMTENDDKRDEMRGWYGFVKAISLGSKLLCYCQKTILPAPSSLNIKWPEAFNFIQKEIE